MFSVLNRSIPRSSCLILTENRNRNFIFKSKLRHSPPLDYFSHIVHHIFTENYSLDSSVYIAPSAEAHAKENSNCWINKRNFSLRSCYRKYHKYIKSDNSRRFFVSLGNSNNMVWITDLDNPQVWSGSDWSFS